MCPKVDYSTYLVEFGLLWAGFKKMRDYTQNQLSARRKGDSARRKAISVRRNRISVDRKGNSVDRSAI
ncbi:hypothetical protein NCCP2050_10010 [Planococcus sp. NCCP-2050]|nr:hypothetical protein NCCP2050_10010 [Planococcus sp. NCCP-2050]